MGETREGGVLTSYTPAYALFHWVRSGDQMISTLTCNMHYAWIGEGIIEAKQAHYATSSASSDVQTHILPYEVRQVFNERRCFLQQGNIVPEHTQMRVQVGSRPQSF